MVDRDSARDVMRQTGPGMEMTLVALTGLLRLVRMQMAV
jgi:hypothetical protein